MASGRGFWSYVHKDDQAERGRIVDLGRDIIAAHGLQTGEPAELFLDTSIEWGEDWERRVDDTLALTVFFIPVVTPSFFNSPQCRRELNYFVRKAEDLGVRELIMPILYVDVPALHSDGGADEAVEIIKRYQWEDWTDTRFEDRGSSAYRRAVAKMATRIAEANVAADQASAARADLADGDEDLDEEDEPGVLDRIGLLEEAMPAWNETLEEINSTVVHIGTVTSDAAKEMESANSSNRPMAARLTVAKRLSNVLSADAGTLEGLAADFTSRLHEVDSGLRAVIDLASASTDPSEKESICDFFTSIKTLVSSAEDGLGAFTGMADSMQPVEGMSRDLRGPLRSLRKSLTLMQEGREVMRPWVGLIDESGFECV